MFHCNDLSRSLYLAFNPLSNRSLPNKNLCPSNFSPNISIRDAYLLQKERKKRERKGNIFNEFQTNGSILFQRFVKKKKKKTFLEKLLPASPSPGESFFTLIRVAGSTPSRGEQGTRRARSRFYCSQVGSPINPPADAKFT